MHNLKLLKSSFLWWYLLVSIITSSGNLRDFFNLYFDIGFKILAVGTCMNPPSANTEKCLGVKYVLQLCNYIGITKQANTQN